jgi:uncharacterized protein YhbP (UPF0306 family)
VDDPRADILALLDAHHVLSLATLHEGAPHAASLFYARRDLRLYWVSDADSRHSLALEATPRVAATIAADHDDYRSVRGLQIHGRAARVTARAEQAAALALLAARYAFFEQFTDGPDALRARLASASFYRLDPRRVTLIDNTRGFGHKQTLEVPLDDD